MSDPGPQETARCRNGHEYTPENTRFTPKGTRRCVACKHVRDRRRTVSGARKAADRRYWLSYKGYARRRRYRLTIARQRTLDALERLTAEEATCQIR